VDTVSSQPGDLLLPIVEAGAGAEFLPAGLAEELYASAKAAECGLGVDEFVGILAAVAARVGYGLGAEGIAALRGLRLEDLALAQGCARGLDAAWERFMDAYREPVRRAAAAICGSGTAGDELAGSLYGDLFGLKQSEGVRRSPLASYSGRGSLMGWLRTTLAQRFVDQHRRTRRETPLESEHEVAAETSEGATPHAAAVAGAVRRTLEPLAAEDRYLLASYFLDRRTLLEIGRILRVHEATISRRLKRLTGDLRKDLLRNLQAGGLSRRAAEEALGTDPRDVEINLRAILQSSQSEAFQVQETR
jgi:RNA polymerase sigma-70 factor, ECF subfamily